MTDTGFSDVAVESAHAFRAIMQAMARPGRVTSIASAIEAPEPLLASTAIVALTLCDFQTPIWLGPHLWTERVVHFLRFHAGAPITGEPGKAQFAFAIAGDTLPCPELLTHGTHEYPDRSSTLIIQVTGFTPGHVELTGPGIQGVAGFGVAGLHPPFWKAMAENHARFPVGIDVIFTAPGEIAALPRSTAIRILELV